MKKDKKISKRIRRLERKTPTSRQIIISATSGSGSGGGGGVTEFLELIDTPSSYSGETLKVVRVNAGETALEFATISGGGHTIQDEGTPLTQRTNLNFVGSAVTVTDGGAGPDSTIVTISGGGSGTVNSGTQYRIAYYASTGTAVSEAGAITAARALKSDANGVPTHFDTSTEPSLTELSYIKGIQQDVVDFIELSYTRSLTQMVW